MRKIILVTVLCMAYFVKGQDQKLYIVGAKSDAEKEFIINNNVSTYTIFYQQFFTTNDKLDEKKLSMLLNKSFPDHKKTGFLVLDWEGEAMKQLVEQKSEIVTENYMQMFISTIREVKKQRPNIKVAFYGLPFRQYWKVDEQYYKKNKKLSQLLKEQDFLAPSLYVFYPQKSSEKNNDAYIKSNLETALRLGKEFNKPVYPFIWHRIHNSNKNFGMTLISPELFKETVSKILSLNYKDTKTAGVFWWHSEVYNYQTRNSSQALKKEYEDIKDFSNYQTKMLQKYYDTIKNLF